MNKFEAVGMRKKIEDPGALVINTCSDNDTKERGSLTRWSWSNPTNRMYPHVYYSYTAVSTECLWQGTKIPRTNPRNEPDPLTLAGDWRRGKGKRPRGAYAGPDAAPITTPGGARRAIYIPAFCSQIERWMAEDETVAEWVQTARDHDGTVYLRDHDTGRGVDRNGPMSHAWLLSVYLNTGRWPA